MTPLEIFGIACAILALIAFVGNQYGKMRAESFLYDFLNFVSAVGLFYYAYETRAYPFLITNTVWAAISGIDVVKHIVKRLRH